MQYMWLFENRIKTCCIWCYIECTVPTLNDLNDDGLTPLDVAETQDILRICYT